MDENLMLSLLPSATLAVATSSSSSSVVDPQLGPHLAVSNAGESFYRIGINYSSSVNSELCSRSGSMGGNSGPAIPKVPPIMPPLTTNCSTAATCDYSSPSPRPYPSPYSPALTPYYVPSSNTSPSSSAAGSGPHSSPSASTATSNQYYFPFSHPNPYSRHYIQIDPNYSAMALAAGLQNPSAAAQLRPFPRTAPIYTVSTGNSSTSPSPTQYSVFPFPPPHHLALHPPINPFPTASPSVIGDHATIPLFGVPNNSPVRLTSRSPDDRSPSSASPQSQISHHSSSPGVISAGCSKGVTIEVHSSSTPTPSALVSSFSAAGSSNVRASASGTGSGGRDLTSKNRQLVRHPNAVSCQGVGHNQDVSPHHRHPKTVTYSNANSSNSQYPTATSLPSNVTVSNVNKLRSATPKRQKLSSSSSSSTASSTSRPPSSSQPPSTSSAQNSSFPVQSIKDSSARANNGCVGNSNSNVKLMYPVHFNKGSIIQLTDGALKCVEDLSTNDFINSAEQSGNLQIDSSTVVRIEIGSHKSDKNGSTVLLGFAVGERKLQVSVEASLEHPFFVFGKGWSSCSPQRTLQRYSLQCHQLIVGDVCISLTHKQNFQRKIGSSNIGSAVVSGENNHTVPVDHQTIGNTNNISNASTIATKTSYLGGTGAKRKRRFSESDASVEHRSRLLANSSDAANPLLTQKLLNQSFK